MKFTKVFILIGMMNYCQFHLTLANRTAMEQLYNTLLLDYNPYVRPNDSQRVRVSLKLLSINGVDELSGILSTVVYVDILWADPRMAWNKKNYDGIRYILVPQNLVWKPDLVVINPVKQVRKIGFDEIMIRYREDGAALWYIGEFFETSCDIDVTYFPFDRQMCRIVIRTWSYMHFELQLFPLREDIGLQNFTENGEWILYDTAIEKVRDGPFESMHFKFYLERRSFFFVVNLFMPVVLLVLLNCMVFLLSADSGERVGYAITCLLSMTVYLTLVADTIPKTSKPISVLSFVMMILLILSAFICFLTIIGLRFHFRNDKKPLPPWLIKVTRALRCFSLKKSRQSVSNEPSCRQRRTKSRENERLDSKTSTSKASMHLHVQNNIKPAMSVVEDPGEWSDPWAYKQPTRIGGDQSEVFYEDYKKVDTPEYKVETWKTFAKLFDKYCFILCVSIIVMLGVMYVLVCIRHLSV